MSAMRELNVNLSGMEVDYAMASRVAAAIAREMNGKEPVMVAWHDKLHARMSPVIEGGDINTRWHDYGASHGGKLQVDINGDYDFIFTDAGRFESPGPSPLVNLHDKAGNQYLCTSSALRDPNNPTEEACVRLEGQNTRGDVA